MLEISAFRACRKDSFFRSSRVWATLSVALTALAFSPAAYSEYELYSAGNFTAKVSAVLYGFAITASGAGTEYKAADNQTNEGEVALEPELDLTYDLDGGGTIYGKWSYVGAATWNFNDDPAPYGWTQRGDHKLTNEWASLGYRNDWVDVSFGAQDFSVGDALLIGDGSLDCGSSGGCGRDSGEFFLGIHKAFRDSAILRVNQVPGVEDVRADIFWLEAGDDVFKGKGSQVWGVNLEYAVPEEGLGFLSAGTLGLMYIAVTAAPVSGANRDGRRYYDLRLEGLTFAALPNTNFYGEVILDGGENNAGQSYSDGYTYYAEIEHNIQGLPWSPQVGYRYFRASGDDPTTSDVEGHDALFYTLLRGWGTWFQGEFAGEWWHNNSNQRTQMVKLVVTPPVSWLSSVKLLGFHNERDRAPYVEGTTTLAYANGDTFDNEVNLLLEYWNDSGFYVAGVFAHGDLGPAGRSELGSDEDFNSAYIWIQQSF